MRILINGGLGFVGGRLGWSLHQAGHQVILGSRNLSIAPNWLPHAEVVKTDWRDECSLKKACSGVDVVIQAAGLNAQNCVNDPATALEVNGLATARLLKAANIVGVKRFFYLSTAHVYASPLIGTISENVCPRNLHPYSTSHLAGENVVLSANQFGQIEGVVLRMSNAFGAPMHKDTNCWMLLVNDICRQIVTNRTLVMRSSGLQRRDFVTLQDVERVFLHLINLSKGQLGNGVFNIGGAWSPRIIDIVELVQERCLATLGFSPQIIRPEVHDDEITYDLDYRIDKLLATGFKLSGNTVAEIDATLLFCREAFGGN